MKPEELLKLAVEAMDHAYVPYSGYRVGAALLCADGTVYQGCNIENASYTPAMRFFRRCTMGSGSLLPLRWWAARTA